MDIKEIDYFSAILKSVAKHIFIDGQEGRRFLSIFKVKKLEAEEVLLYPGEICKQEIFIVEGKLHLYEKNDDGGIEEILSAGRSEWFNERHSFLTDEPTPYYLAAAEESFLLTMDKKHLRWLFKKVPQFQQFFKEQMEIHFIKMETARRQLNQRRKAK